MMLKINKTLPKNKARQYNKSDNISTNATNVVNTHHSIVYRIALVTLICGIMPGLMGLSYYNTNSSFGFSSNKAYAVEVKTLSDITTMQELTQPICGNTEIGTSKVLIDTRDNSDYQVAKLSDGNCWMAQNLRLAGGTVLNRMDTDLDPSVYTTDEQTYTLPETTDGGFSDIKLADSNGVETYMNHQVRNSTDSDYGAYYSWCAATAGTCQIGGYTDIQPKLNDTDGVYYTASPANTSAISADNSASSSICPKGWKLPAHAGYNVLKNGGIVKMGSFASSSTTSGYWIGDSASNGIGGAFFLAAGYVITNGLGGVGLSGRYWSSAANSATTGYSLRFDRAGIDPSGSNSRCYGFSVRCLVNGNVAKDSNVSVVVSPTLTLDTVTGAEDIEADPSSIAYGTITATVSSNTNYIVQLSSNKPNLTDPTNHPDIEGIPASSNVVAGTNAWGIQNNLNDNTRLSDYSPITTTPTSFYNTTNYDETTQSTTHTFTIGVSVAPSLPAGEYSTTVTVMAVNN